ncbi:MAG: phage/plasmid primase, P4 family [Actinomycetota bacterium]|nr:phage/plasmid primase, P4 family [Actinomycetota bacterium]
MPLDDGYFDDLLNDELTTTAGTTPATNGPMAGVDGFRYTDAGNAERFLHRHAQEVRFVPLWRRWLAYDGTRWRLDHSDTLVAHLAAQIGAQLVQRVPEVYGEPSKLNPLIAAVRRAESAAGVSATLTMAASKPGVAIDHEALDADPWLLNVANGTIDLRTGQRRPHDPLDLLMMVAKVDHDPAAVAPCWELFLEQILPDNEVRRFVARLCGLALVGTQIEHVLVICLGGGANGKSTMTKVIADVLGEYAIVAARDVLLALKHDAHPTAKADLFRRRFAHSGELPPAAKLDEAQVKELTGGDRIKARRMREDHWEFDPSHLLWLHANHRPMIEGTDDGKHRVQFGRLWHVLSAFGSGRACYGSLVRQVVGSSAQATRPVAGGESNRIVQEEEWCPRVRFIQRVRPISVGRLTGDPQRSDMMTHEISVLINEATAVSGEEPAPLSCVEIAERVDSISKGHSSPE